MRTATSCFGSFFVYDHFRDGPEEEEDERDWQPLTIQDAFALLSELATVLKIDDGPHVGGGYMSIHPRGCRLLASGDGNRFACKDRTRHIQCGYALLPHGWDWCWSQLRLGHEVYRCDRNWGIASPRHSFQLQAF